MSRFIQYQETIPFLERGFRPFFLLAGASGCIALSLWIWVLTGRGGSHLAAIDAGWHAHEMIYGYLMAVVAGFVLTAVPSWTGRPPLRGFPLLALAILWFAGRATTVIADGHEGALGLLHHGFPLLLAVLLFREVLAAGNLRNLPVCVLVAILALSDLGQHDVGAMGWDPAVSQRLALGCMALLLTLIGGRVTPAFTRNWMKRTGIAPLPAEFSSVDRSSLGLTFAAILGWIVSPSATPTAALMAVAGVAHLVRMLRWRGWATWREPLVAVLHLGYGWIAIWMLLSAMSVGWPALISASSALHALTAGALTLMPLAVMTRAILGHTGRPLKANAMTCVVFATALLAGVLRVGAHALTLPYTDALILSGALWAGAHALFLLGYGPLLLQRSSDGD